VEDVMRASHSRMLVPIVAVLFSLLPAWGSAGARPKTACLDGAQAIFGEPAHLKPRLYEVDKDYALRFTVDKYCEIRRADVLPKYDWEEVVPSWKEPDYSVGLSEQKYAEILAKIGRLKPIGNLVSEGVGYAVMNSKVSPVDEYEQAFVKRVVYCCAEDGPASIFSFSVIFTRKVEGKVEDVKQFTLPNGGKRIEVNISDDWYLISPEEFKKVKVGRTTVLNVAGPVS
jgi:hypothetical protein